MATCHAAECKQSN